MQSIAANAAQAATQVVNTTPTTGGAGGVLNNQKDASHSSTAPQFGEVLNQIQAKYGTKTEKPREIKKTLGKDDFLRIMLTQMRHQDPTNPFKAEQMAAEMAQFTSVEQLQNLNQGMQKMATQNQPLERLAMTQLIGKQITVDRDRFAHVEGQKDVLSFHLPKPASDVRIVVISEVGEVVMEKSLGAQKQGENSHTWDGLKNGVLPAKSGNYVLRVEAKDESGLSIQTNPLHKVKVVGVSFEGSEPILLVGDHQRQDKIGMKNVVRIESEEVGSSGSNEKSLVMKGGEK